MTPNPDAIYDALSLAGGVVLILAGGGFLAAVVLGFVMHKRRLRQLEQAGRL